MVLSVLRDRMRYHGNCVVCVMTLVLCILGSFSASTGVCLLLNFQIFGGNATTVRTLPGGPWTEAGGIAMIGVGSVMFLSGLSVAVCCLTVGVSLSCTKETVGKYRVFENENEIPGEQVAQIKPRDEVTSHDNNLSDSAYDEDFLAAQNHPTEKVTTSSIPTTIMEVDDETVSFESIPEKKAMLEENLEPVNCCDRSQEYPTL